MADPLSLTTSIISLIQFSYRLAQRAKEVTSLKPNSNDYERLSQELESVHTILERYLRMDESSSLLPYQEQNLKRFISDDGDSAANLVRYLNLSMESLRDTLVTTEKNLAKQGKRSTMRWKPWGTQRTVDSATQSLRQSKESMRLLITILELASKTQNRLTGSEIGFSHHTKDRDLAIMDWLTVLDYRSRHLDLSRIRARGTGHWLLAESPVFRSWVTGEPPSNKNSLGNITPEKDRKTTGRERGQSASTRRRQEKTRPSNVLWCYGQPGSGKSVLMSRVVDHLLEKASKDQNIGVAYFYFDFCMKVSPRDVLASLLRQLCLQNGLVAPSLVQLWESRDDPKSPPEPGELLVAFLDLASKFKQTYICLDALDECADEYQHALREMVLRLMKSRCFLIITSRPWPIYSDLLRGIPQIAVGASEDDIKSYVALVVEKSAELADIVDGNLQNQIAEIITEKSNGMFLFAVLQMQQLLNQTSVYELKEALQSIPSDLTGVYDNVLQGLKEQSPNRANLAMRVLMWLSYSARTLTVQELQHALAIDTKSRAFDPERIPPERFIEEVCMELVTIDKERNVVLLTHASLKHYLVNLRNKLFPRGEEEIALRCLTYMNIPELSLPCEMDEDYTQRVKKFPFAVYIGQHWGIHMSDYWKDEIPERVYDFLVDEQRLAAFAQLQHIGGSITSKNCLDYPSTHALHVVAYFGMLEAAQYPPIRNNFDVDSWGRTALHLACEQDHADVAALFLLDNFPIDAINAQDRNGKSALHYACIKGNTSIVENLLSHDAAAYLKDVDTKTAFEHAAENGHAAIVTQLLPHLIDEGNALSIAAAAGHAQVVSLLLDSGCDLQEDLALLKAARAGFEDIVENLLERGADLNAKDDQGMTALHHAASEGRTAMAKLLLMNGCDVQARDQKGRTALYFAAEKGDEPTVKVLVESGAEIEARTNEGRTALIESAAVGNVSVVEFLLWRGASIGSTSSSESSGSEEIQENALQLASRHGHLSVVKLLLEKYSDPDGRGTTDRTPLSYAAQKGHAAVVELLLATPGVDPNAQDSHGRTALSYAATNGDESTVSLLLRHKSDPNSKDSLGRTPLSYAVETGNEGAVRLLLGNMNVDLNYRDSKGMSINDYVMTTGTPIRESLSEILAGSKSRPLTKTMTFKFESVKYAPKPDYLRAK